MPKLIEQGWRILKKLLEHNLFVKPDKCAFFVKEVKFLGFVICNGQLKMNDAKIDGIAKWPSPENVLQLQSFLGFCNFYHRFIDHYSNKCQPLNLLLQKARGWIWTVDQHTVECNASLFATG